MFYKNIFITIVICLIAEISYSQGLFDSSTADKDSGQKMLIDFSGYGRGSAYAGSELYDYNNIFAEFGMQGRVSWKKAVLFSDLRLRGGYQFDSLYATFQLKETFAGFQSEKIDLYFGAKIVSWGRMDGFNPTDNITPYDYFFLTPDADDQKLPNLLGHNTSN